MMDDQAIDLGFERGVAKRPTRTAPRTLTHVTVIGLAVGALAQMLTISESRGAVAALGASTAAWVTIAFLLAVRTARSWSDRDRWAWTSVVTAAYFYCWLIAYHLLSAAIEGVPPWMVWAEARVWVVAVAPACALLSLLAIGSLRTGRLGDMCLAAPLAWSIPEVVQAAYDGWSFVVLITIPTLLAAVMPLHMVRGRRPRPLVVTLTAALGGAAFTALRPLLVTTLHLW